MSVYVLSCEWNDNFDTLGVYTSLASALESLTRKYLEEDERIEDFSAVSNQRSVIYTNFTTYVIDEHVLDGVEE